VGLRFATPVLGVRDVASAAAFVRDRLGFELRGTWGDPPGFAILRRDGVELFLQTDCERGGAAPKAGEGWSVYFACDDVDGLHAELAGRGAPVLSRPTDQVYHQRELEVGGPEGHVIVFAQSLN